MKRLAALLAGVLAAGYALGQQEPRGYVIPKEGFVTDKNPTPVVVGGGSGAPTDATYITQTPNATLSAEQALSALGTGLVFNTTATGVLSIYTGTSCTNQFPRSLNASGAATCATVDVASGGTGIGSGTSGGIPYFSGATTMASSAALTAHGVMIGGGAGTAPTSTSAGTAGQILYSTGASSDPAFQSGATTGATTGYPGMTRDPTLAAVVFEDFFARPANGGAATPSSVGQLYILGSGTSSGAAGPQALLSDGNHPGVLYAVTGTTTTGNYFVGGGHLFNSSSDQIAATTGTIVECIAWVSAVSDGTNTSKVRCGLMDSAAADATDGANIYWDNNADTHWGCNSDSNGTTSNTLSTTVATAGAWHKLRTWIETAGSSVRYYVDGSELSCSPHTNSANIPSGATRGMSFGFAQTASAGCSNATWGNAASCGTALDAIYFYNPLISSR